MFLQEAVALPPVKNKAVIPDKLLKGPMLRWEEFGDDQLKQMLSQMDSEVEIEVEGLCFYFIFYFSFILLQQSSKNTTNSRCKFWSVSV